MKKFRQGLLPITLVLIGFAPFSQAHSMPATHVERRAAREPASCAEIMRDGISLDEAVRRAEAAISRARGAHRCTGRRRPQGLRAQTVVRRRPRNHRAYRRRHRKDALTSCEPWWSRTKRRCVRVCATQLVEQGFTVDVAADGDEGLFAGTEYPLDIAVIDLGLPKLSGPRSHPQPAQGRQEIPDPHSHGARSLAGQGRRAAGGRRRLRREAVSLRRSAGAHAGAVAPRGRLGLADPRMRPDPSRHARAGGHARTVRRSS